MSNYICCIDDKEITARTAPELKRKLRKEAPEIIQEMNNLLEKNYETR